MAKQFSVFNSAKGGVENKAFPPRPWSQQVEDASKLEIRDKVTKVTKDVNIEEIVHHETPFAAAIEGLFTNNCCLIICDSRFQLFVDNFQLRLKTKSVP